MIVFARLDQETDPYVVDLCEEVEGWRLKREMLTTQHLKLMLPVIFRLADLQQLDAQGEIDLEGLLEQDREIPLFILMGAEDFETFLPSGKRILVLDQERASRVHLPLVRMALADFEGRFSESQEKLSTGVGLSQLVTHSLKELQRVRKIHETLVPLREEKLKAITLSSKFAAGEASGGEFHDVFEGEREIVFLLTHSSSYVLTSQVLSLFSELKESRRYDREGIEFFLKQLSKESTGQIKTGHELQLFILHIDLKSLEAFGFNFGSTSLCSTHPLKCSANTFPFSEAFLEKAYFEGRLERDGKYVFLSPGVEKNWKEQPLQGVVTKLISKGPKHLLNEIFYRLRRGREETFLDYDASVIYLEVDSHAIYQI